MTMNADDIEAVVFYRKQKAYSTFKEAEEMIATAHWNLAIQRLYYACFLYGISFIGEEQNICTNS